MISPDQRSVKKSDYDYDFRVAIYPILIVVIIVVEKLRPDSGHGLRRDPAAAVLRLTIFRQS